MRPVHTIRKPAAAAAAAALLAGLGLAALPALAKEPAAARAGATATYPAEPALWVVRDADSTLYLFGTVHILKPDTVWRTPRIEQAFNASDELVLEIANVGDPAAMAPAIQKHGLDLARPLSSKLNEQDKARLATVAQSLGIPVATFEPLRPWLASVQILVASLVKMGFDPNAGVDKLLQQAADKAGKPVRGFETAEQQMSFFGGLAPELELELFRESLEDFEEGAAMLDRLAAGWSTGNLSVLEGELVTDMKTEAPELYKVILVDRNVDWANQIEEKLKGKGTSFIAVGSGHLVGADSVQVQLARKGIKAERM